MAIGPGVVRSAEQHVWAQPIEYDYDRDWLMPRLVVRARGALWIGVLPMQRKVLMASGTLARAARQDWILANPWPWAFLGAAICLVNWALVLLLGESLSGLGLSCVCLGLLAVGVGVAIRLNSSAPAFLDQAAPQVRNKVLLGLTLLFTVVALVTTTLLLLRFFDINPFAWRLNSLLIFWVLVGPMSLAAAAGCARRLKASGTHGQAANMTLTPAEEGAALLALAALAAFAAGRALYNPDSPEDWDTLRLALSVLFVVTVGAAPLLLLSQHIRRLVISVLVVLHFGGISTAVLSPPPSPWIAQQAWARIYQPYLEFMYLNNAYHFYAPEPGPASYLWFRMYYEDPEGKLWAHWLKIPDLDDKGWHKNTLALEYQRILAITENCVPSEPLPSMYVTRADGTTVYANWYARRMEHSPNLLNTQTVLGKEAPTGLLIPYPFFVPLPQQYLPPTASSKQLLASYARHICRTKHHEHPEWKINSVKVYRVVHMIPNMSAFVNDRLDPRDPDNYRPYYMGKYDPSGKLLDGNEYDASGKLTKPGDPFLYWLLPMMRDPPTHVVKSPVRSWVARHADDPDWIYTYDETLQRPLLEQERINLKREALLKP